MLDHIMQISAQGATDPSYTGQFIYYTSNITKASISKGWVPGEKLSETYELVCSEYIYNWFGDIIF